MIELGEFIEDVINQIFKAIGSVSDNATNPRGIVNPPLSSRPKNKYVSIYIDDTKGTLFYVPQMIEFDLAIELKKGHETEGKAGIFVAPIAGGVTGKSDVTNIQTNRIKFSIPVLYPINPDDQKTIEGYKIIY